MPVPAYEIIDLVKRYRTDQPLANDHINLSVHQGEVFGLLGPNGAGKTTLVRQMAGLIKPTSGTIHLFGHDLIKEPARGGQYVAVQPQGFALPRTVGAQALLEVTGQMRGLSQPAARQETAQLLEEFGLTPYARRSFDNLSGGLRRLLAIASALVGRRPVLIFDEPTNDLDPEVRRVIWQRIRTSANAGSAVVLVTHNVVEAEQALDRVAIIRAGKVLVMGTPGELKAKVQKLVRLELLFRPETAPAAADLLTGFANVRNVGTRRFLITVTRPEAESALARLLSSLNLLDDFRIVTPNLEDVYLELSGGERLES
ncbi:MAG TPA: ABC transporter ATP-binding protein [Symbiobacteriaceae bacterium]|jgi:ABC-2 type transport system ATP-binding protein